MVHISEISFCDKVGFNIKSNDTKKWILDSLENRYGIKIISRHFEKFQERSMKNLNNNLHMLCVRTNGNPYFLYLVKINFTNYCILIDKKVQQGYFYPRMILVKLHFDNVLFDQETIFDGEMVKNGDNTWTYLINDIIVNAGTYLNNMNLAKRLHVCFDMLEKHFSPSSMDVFNIIVKAYFKYDELEYMINTYVPGRPYTCRGIYFRSLYLKFKDTLVNFDDSLVQKVERIKFKDVKQFMLKEDTPEKHITKQQLVPSPIPSPSPTASVISHEDVLATTSELVRKFMVKKTSDPDVYELYTGTQDKVFGLACIPNMKTSKYMKKIFQDKNIVTKIELELEYSSRFNKYIPIVKEI